MAKQSANLTGFMIMVYMEPLPIASRSFRSTDRTSSTLIRKHTIVIIEGYAKCAL